VGVLLAELARVTPSDAGKASGVARSNVSDDGTRSTVSPYAEALTTNGITRQTAHRYQALAAVPPAVLLLCRSGKIKKPSTEAGLIR
jgi:hypothetical protein